MISIGDRLRLNDRGPVLFAQEQGPDARVKCSWMDPMGQWHVGEFASADLHKLDDDEVEVPRRSGSRWSSLITRVSSFVW